MFSLKYNMVNSEAYLMLFLITTAFHFILHYINGRTDVRVSVCLSVGMWRANGNQNPCPNLDEILNAHPHLFKEGFGASLTIAPSFIWGWGRGGGETPKAEGHTFENHLQNKRCSAGCKLTRAVPGTSAGPLIILDTGQIPLHFQQPGAMTKENPSQGKEAKIIGNT